MGSSLGTISIDFNSEIAKFVNNNERAGKSLDGVAAKAKEHEGLGGNLFGNMVGAELLAGGIEKVADMAGEMVRRMAEMVSETMEEVAAADRMAKSFEISTSNLMAMQSAAKLGAHLDTQSFNTSFEHMAAQIGEAAERGGEAEEAFKRIGLTSRQLRAEGMDAAFHDVAHALGDVRDAADRAALAKEIFGKAGVADMPLFGQGLDEAEEKARKFKAALSDVDVAKVSAANEQWETVGMQFKGLENQLTVLLSPAMEAFGKVASSVLSMVSDNIEGFSHVISYVGPSIEAMAETVSMFFDGVDSVLVAYRNAFDWLVGAADDTAKATELAAKAAEQAQRDNAAKVMAEDAIRARGEVDKLRKSLETEVATRGMTESAKKVYELRQQFQYIPPDVENAIRSIADLQRQLDDTKKADEGIKKLVDSLAEMNAQFLELGMSEADRKVFEIGRKFEDIPGYLQLSVRHLQDMQRELNQLANFGKIESQLGKLRQEIAAGGDETARWLQQFKDAGASTHQLDQFKALHAQQLAMNEAVEQHKKIVEEVNRLVDAGKTPWQKLGDELRKIQEALSRGDITKDQAEKAKNQLQIEANAKGGGGEVASITRRFDFKMPGNHTTNSQYAKQTAEHTFEIVNILHKIEKKEEVTIEVAGP